MSNVTKSAFGERVHALLAELFGGAHNMRYYIGKNVDWSAWYYIDVPIKHAANLSTYDGDRLTRLVFLAHQECIRVEINPCNMQYIRVGFSPRDPEIVNAFTLTRHPTLAEAVQRFEESRKQGQG